MLLEARVERLESHFDSLDSAVRSLIKITGDTHQEILATRQEMRTRFTQQDQKMRTQFAEQDQKMRTQFAEQDQKIAGVKADVSALAEAMLAGFKRSDEQHAETREQVRQLELLIRQRLPSN
ncbi:MULTISPECIES: hypothetical protein [unclassified Endozoicomonas]|uniref:hypothetical protein n=1 Tax=unclassified Endozoicomonas TaxID=2644528 RepID=UPI0021472040|nr:MULTISPECIES: hypothetical protein [unclassified Endozoicomonas]